MAKSERIIRCHQCPTIECFDGYPKGLPAYCQANKFLEVIEATKKEYFKPEELQIHLATRKLSTRGLSRWPRVQEAIEFARELGVSKVGVAFCVAMFAEAREFAKLLSMAGLEVISVNCFVGAVPAAETGIPEELRVEYAFGETDLTCNPLAQAEILNREHTELNFLVGLCMGHDTLFIMHSKAPVTCMTVKDRAVGNNPSAVLHSPYWLRRLREEYGGKKEMLTSSSFRS